MSRVRLRGTLYFKVPEEQALRFETPLKDCLIRLRDLTNDYHLSFEVETGASISPIFISGDMELAKAEAIRQEALHCVYQWRDTEEWIVDVLG